VGLLYPEGYSVNEESVSRAVDDLRRRVHFVKILGSYPRAK
jgi:prephenate dehydratase